MATNKFDSLMKRTARELASSQKDSIDWFKDTVSEVQKKQQRTDPNKIFKKVSSPQIGSMFLFFYDAKYKTTLPFFDMHPLVIPIEMYIDGFLGVNLHYLPPLARVQLLKALDDTKNNDKYNETTKLLVSYELLKRYSTQFKRNEECIKRYLFSHVRSSFHTVNPSDWEKAALLPLQSWSVNPNKRYSGSPPY
jgi:hypothetical protein